MISRFPLLVLAGTLASAGPALADGSQPVDTHLAITGLASGEQPRAGELRPLHAHLATLGEGGASAVVYYTVEGADFRVVTTLGTDQDGAAAPARLVSYLAPGQKAEVGVAGAGDTEPAVLEIDRVGDRLLVRAAPARRQG
jgi:hypothetical protein